MGGAFILPLSRRKGEEKQRNEMKATFSRDKFWRDGMEELQPFPLL
ncbi:hypothetical protein NC652_014747 [Populus alba x Populus x berolinensis]|nr:hypothetical protein NC652_014747 [Populus alba x Populus x berolinensis]